MIKAKVKKLFNGYASVRSYIVKEAKDKEEDLIITLRNEKMVVPYRKLENGIMSTKLYFSSKWGRNPYYLIDFEWKPTRQLSLW